MQRILVLFGTRPEAIKLAPVIAALRSRGSELSTIVCSTGQHRDMLDQATQLFDLKCDFDLNVMRPNQSLAAMTSRLFVAIDDVIAGARPDWVVVQGDTTTAFVGATVAHYHRCRIAHVEAGLRTHDKWRPFPEEFNRRCVDIVADAYFAPTAWSRDALLREGVAEDRIVVTGNTVIDAALSVASRPFDWAVSPLLRVRCDRPIVLITAHRRESFGAGLDEICAAIGTLAEDPALQGTQFVFPVHPNPNVRMAVHRLLGERPHVHLLVPLDYQSLINLLKQSTLVLTDSGGIQEEAPAFGVPVCVMRDTTERPEGVVAGVAKLVGTQRGPIVNAATELLKSPEARQSMVRGINPYGDGRAAERIAQYLVQASQ